MKVSDSDVIACMARIPELDDTATLDQWEFDSKTEPAAVYPAEDFGMHVEGSVSD